MPEASFLNFLSWEQMVLLFKVIVNSQLRPYYDSLWLVTSWIIGAHSLILLKTWKGWTLWGSYTITWYSLSASLILFSELNSFRMMQLWPSIATLSPIDNTFSAYITHWLPASNPGLVQQSQHLCPPGACTATIWCRTAHSHGSGNNSSHLCLGLKTAARTSKSSSILD